MQKTLILIDIDTKAQITPSGAYVNRTEFMPKIDRGQWQILCFQFYNRDVDKQGRVTLTPAILPPTASYILVGDNDFLDDNSLMFKSIQNATPFAEDDPESNRINIENDWIDGTTADTNKGQLSVRVNADTEKFKTVVSNEASVLYGLYMNVKQFEKGLSNPSNIAWIQFIAQNTIRDWGDATEIPPTGTEYITQINAYLKNPLEREWSNDGIDWSPIKDETHKIYYRERIANIGADWSVKIPAASGERGYTFTPSVSAEGVISWSNNGNLPNPDPINIKGADGKQGIDGKQGENGLTPTIGDNGNWYLGAEDTKKPASVGSLWAIPRIFYSYDDAEFGLCNRLDDSMTRLEFVENFEQLGKIKMLVQSASSTITGNIVLSCKFVDGTQQAEKEITIPVTTTKTWQTLDLSGMALRSGTLTITRLTGNPSDTLKDSSTVISAIVKTVRYQEGLGE